MLVVVSFSAGTLAVATRFEATGLTVPKRIPSTRGMRTVAVEVHFVYGNYIDEVLFKFDYEPLWVVPTYYLHDHLYSLVALVSCGGDVVERYEYDAYGDCNILEPNFAPDPDQKSDWSNPYLFTGRRVDILDDGSLKIQYNRNRYYDYHTGRWLTQRSTGSNKEKTEAGPTVSIERAINGIQMRPGFAKQWLLIVNFCFVIKNCFGYTEVFHFEKRDGILEFVRWQKVMML